MSLNITLKWVFLWLYVWHIFVQMHTKALDLPSGRGFLLPAATQPRIANVTPGSFAFAVKQVHGSQNGFLAHNLQINLIVYWSRDNGRHHAAKSSLTSLDAEESVLIQITRMAPSDSVVLHEDWRPDTPESRNQLETTLRVGI